MLTGPPPNPTPADALQVRREGHTVSQSGNLRSTHAGKLRSTSSPRSRHGGASPRQRQSRPSVAVLHAAEADVCLGSGAQPHDVGVARAHTGPGRLADDDVRLTSRQAM